ncbi:MAG: class I SAM-dependent methyltransferase [Pseudomonadota bacterium]
MALAALKRAMPLPLRRAVWRLREMAGHGAPATPDFWHAGEDASLEQSELGRWFAANEGRVVDKWHHYFEIYERHFERFRGTGVRMLEIGVQNGGSQAMWRRYLGPDAVLYGIDIDEACRALDGEAGHVRIGSQDDPRFLKRLMEEMGGVDIVLDDGSHVMEHIATSFETLFPHLSEGGVYMVEDLQTAYWDGFGGGLGRKGTFIERAKGVVDDMHHWYHGQPVGAGLTKDKVFATHFYDSIVVIEKREIARPRRSARGRVAEVAAKPVEQMETARQGGRDRGAA